MTQAYRLQLECFSYIIMGEQYIGWCPLEDAAVYGEDFEDFGSGVAITYPEHDLLWLLSSPRDEAPECLNTLGKFRREFSSLPRWEATRYVVDESVRVDSTGRVLDTLLELFDCRTGQNLFGTDNDEPLPGREAEVERLRRGIEQMMRGEHFRFFM
jgi:hypothetical protein